MLVPMAEIVIPLNSAHDLARNDKTIKNMLLILV
jgi:hypothetical protein